MRTAIDEFRPGVLLSRPWPIWPGGRPHGSSWKESPFGYLIRLAEANHYSAGVLGSLLSVSWRPRRSDRLALAASISSLEPRTYIPSSIFEALAYSAVSAGSRMVNFQGVLISEEMIEFQKPKFCPLCLASDVPYRRSAWDLRFFAACPIHGVWLAWKCPRCGKARDWRVIRVTRCRCGYDYRAIRPEPCHDTITDLSALLAKRLGAELSYEPRYSSEITELCLSDLLELIEFVGTPLIPFSPTPAGKGVERPLAFAARAARLLANPELLLPELICDPRSRLQQRRKPGWLKIIAKWVRLNIAARERAERRDRQTIRETQRWAWPACVRPPHHRELLLGRRARRVTKRIRSPRLW